MAPLASGITDGEQLAGNKEGGGPEAGADWTVSGSRIPPRRAISQSKRLSSQKGFGVSNR